MAYINVAEWTPDQVTDWLKGLDDSMYKYVHSFTNNEVDGRQLLNIRPYELEQLGMDFIGHQEIVLEAVENLRNFHFNLDKENLQFMALHVATAARSLHRQLAKHCDASKIETKILNDITRTIGTIKPLIGWLDRAPFRGQYQFTEICRNMLRLGLEMATIAQRDRFVERPVEQIRVTADKLERLANYIIQDITDPMLLQPASLNLVTLKKRDSELGFSIESNYHGIHRVTDIKYNSPAHNSGKIEDGDEIVQINYQTVVAWQYKKVIFFLHESLPDVLLTLKKRPKHTKIYGQIYMQPYRLPSKKRAMGNRWGENLPSPRAGFLTVPEADFNLLKAEEKITAIASSDTDSSCSDILTPTDTKTTEKEIRLYYPKPRAMLQRRNTICGDELLGLKCVGGVPQWHERKTGAVCDPSSPSLRDKSVSFGFGLEIASRPTTCIGIATSVGGKFESSDAKGLFTDVKKLKLVSENEQQMDADIDDKSKPGVSKVVRFDARMKYEDHPMDEKYICNVEDTILQTFEPIPFADEEEDEEINALRNSSEKAKDILEVLDRVSNNNSLPFVEAVNFPVITRRGRLDKSHSTPAYDNSGEESDTPPAVEPRKEFLLQTPPIPPPRPRKQKDLLPSVIPPPPPKPPGLMNSLALKIVPESAELHNVNTKASADWNYVIIKVSSELCVEANELHTPSKTRTLTLKKKHSLISKRRNINLKILGTGDIQGHLYRRTKDRRGVTFWARLYFVMMDTILYGFRSKESLKASCVIFLPGFTVSLAKEVHSKPYAFKVYHSAKTFYFAAESQDALNQWVDFIRQAVLQPNAVSSILRPPDSPGDDINTKDLFSETDSSGEESELMVTKNLCTPSPQGAKDIVTTFSKSTLTPTSSAKHERRYLGSLRKLTKGSLPFKCSSSAEKKPSSDIPVPTDQYRSYRRVPGGSFGIQIGTNTPGYHHDSTLLHACNIHSTTHSAEQYIPTRKLSISSSSSVVTNGGIGGDGSDCFGPPSSPAPTLDSVSMPLPTNVISIVKVSCNNTDISFDNSDHSAMKKIPYNFIHASNPNLVEFDFQTSKTLDYSLPKINPSNSWDAHHNIQGFVTLKDLMLQKQEEEAQEMYNNRVLLGVEKKDERKRNALRRSEEKQQQESSSFQKHSSSEARGGGVVSKTQNRSLPKTPDYEISFKPDDEAIKKTRTKEGLKLRDFGYELISGDEPIGGAGVTASRQNSNASSSSADHHNYEHSWTGAMKSGQFLKSQPFLISSHKSKKHSNNNCPSGNTSELGAGVSSSIKKKGKLEAFKSERMFQFNKQSTGSSSGMTMTLPSNKTPNHALSSSASSSGGIKKSHTYNNDLKVKAASSDKYEAHRKNSAPIPIFSKLTTFASGSAATSIGSGNNKSSKEKRLLGSPLLHRTIFGNHQHYSPNSGVPQTSTGREYDGEIFSQVIFPKVSSHHNTESSEPKFRNGVSLSSSSTNISAPEVVAPPPPTTHERDAKNTNSGSKAATPEYPNMECPPVFEPEIYSLTDSSASLTFLLRRKNSAVASLDEKQ